MADSDEQIEVRKDLSIKKQSFSPKAAAAEGALGEAAEPDPAALQEEIGLRRRMGGAEVRSNEEDDAMAAEQNAASEPPDEAEIAEDD